MVSFGKFYAKIRDFKRNKTEFTPKIRDFKRNYEIWKKRFEIYSNWGFFDTFIPEKLIFLLKLEPFKWLLP